MEQEWEGAEEKAQAIVKAEPRMAIAMGRRAEIREIAYRIQKMAPGGMKYTPEECVVLAQYAVALEANPFVGEVYLMKNFRTGEVIGLTPGIRLYRRRADEQDKAAGDVRWIEYDQLTDSEREIYGVPPDAMAIKAMLYNQNVVRAYTENAERMMSSGAKWEDVKAVLGTRPHAEGIGVLTRAEIDALDRNSSNKMPHIERLRKRAEAAALKTRYHLEFGFVPLASGVVIERGSLAEDFIDVKVERMDPPQALSDSVRKVQDMMDATEGVVKPDPSKSEEERAVALKRAGSAMWQGMESVSRRDWPQQALDYVTGAYGLSGDPESAAVLDLSNLEENASIEDVRAWCDAYFGERKSGASAAQSADAANSKAAEPAKKGGKRK